MGKKAYANFLETIEMDETLLNIQTEPIQERRPSFLYSLFVFDRITGILIFFIGLVILIFLLWFLINH